MTRVPPTRRVHRAEFAALRRRSGGPAGHLGRRHRRPGGPDAGCSHRRSAESRQTSHRSTGSHSKAEVAVSHPHNRDHGPGTTPGPCRSVGVRGDGSEPASRAARQGGLLGRARLVLRVERTTTNAMLVRATSRMPSSTSVRPSAFEALSQSGRGLALMHSVAGRPSSSVPMPLTSEVGAAMAVTVGDVGVWVGFVMAEAPARVHDAEHDHEARNDDEHGEHAAHGPIVASTTRPVGSGHADPVVRR